MWRAKTIAYKRGFFVNENLLLPVVHNLFKL